MNRSELIKHGVIAPSPKVPTIRTRDGVEAVGTLCRLNPWRAHRESQLNRRVLRIDRLTVKEVNRERMKWS